MPAPLPQRQAAVFRQSADEAADAVERAVPAGGAHIKGFSNIGEFHERPGDELREKREILQQLAEAARAVFGAAVDAAAVVRHTERIDLALTELVQIRIFQLYVVQICPVGLVDHRPGMVVVRARFMPRDDISLIAEPPRAVHERRGEAIAVALALLQKGFRRFLRPICRPGLIMRHGKILEIVADVVKHGLQPRRCPGYCPEASARCPRPAPRFRWYSGRLRRR